MRIASVCAVLFGAAGLFGGMGLGGPASAQVPEGYEVVVLANDPGIHSRPEINNRSEVVWASAFPPDVSDVWLYSDGVIRKISDDGGYDVYPTQNDEGLVPWMRCESYFDTECELATHQDGILATVPTPFSVDQMGDVNNDGTIFWAHDFSETFEHVELFRTGDGITEQITSSGLANQVPRTNSDGDVVWVEYNFFVSPWRSRVMLWLAGAREPMELTDGTGNPQGVDLSDTLRTVFRQYDGSEHVIRMWENGVVTTISPGTNPRINTRGDIAFGRWDENTQIRYQVLFTDGVFYQLPSTIGWWSAQGDVNDLREVAWRERDQSGNTRIMMLRKVGSVGDFNGDCLVDSFDFAQFQRCFTGANAGPPSGLPGDCTRGDFDADGDIDVDDYSAFLDARTEPGVEGPSCAP